MRPKVEENVSNGSKEPIKREIERKERVKRKVKKELRELREGKSNKVRIEKHRR